MSRYTEDNLKALLTEAIGKALEKAQSLEERENNSMNMIDMYLNSRNKTPVVKDMFRKNEYVLKGYRNGHDRVEYRIDTNVKLNSNGETAYSFIFTMPEDTMPQHCSIVTNSTHNYCVMLVRWLERKGPTYEPIAYYRAVDWYSSSGLSNYAHSSRYDRLSKQLEVKVKNSVFHDWHKDNVRSNHAWVI